MKTKKTELTNFSCGDVFEHENKYYLVTDQVKTKRIPYDSKYIYFKTVVNLKSGIISELDCSKKFKLIKIALIIKE